MSIKKVTYKDRHGATATVEYGAGDIRSPNDIRSVLAEVMGSMSVPKSEGIDHPGEPKGPDTVPAWLTPGEFVMNAEATKMFEPQLNAMNEQGRQIQRAQGGTIPEGQSQPLPVPDENGNFAKGGEVKYHAAGSIPTDQWGYYDIPAYEEEFLVSPVEDAAIEAYKAGATPADIQRLSGVQVGAEVPRVDVPAVDDRNFFERKVDEFNQWKGDKNQAANEAEAAKRVYGDEIPTSADIPNSPDFVPPTPQESRSVPTPEGYDVNTFEDMGHLPDQGAVALEDATRDVLNVATYNEEDGTQTPLGDKILGKGEEKPVETPQQQAAAEVDDLAKLDSIINGDSPEGNDIATKPAEDIATAGTEALEKDPSLGDKIGGWFKEAFKNVVDPDKMAEAALMYLGSRAMGYSHDGSLWWVGRNYAKHIGDKQTIAQRAQLSGEYEADSIKKYEDTGDIKDLKKRNLITTTGKSDEYVSSDGRKRQLLREVKDSSGNTYWVDKSGKTVDTAGLRTKSQYREDANYTRDVTTNHNKEMISKYDPDGELKLASKMPTQAQQNQDVLDFAQENGIPLEEAGRIYTLAYENALREATTNNKSINSLQPYMQAAIVPTMVGSQDVFAVGINEDTGERINASAEDITKVSKAATKIASRYKGKYSMADVYSSMLAAYQQLPQEKRDYFDSRARDGKENGFMVFINENANKL